MVARIAFLMGAVWAACTGVAGAQASSSPADSGWAVYRNAAMGFTVRYPSDWLVFRITSADTTKQQSVGLRARRRTGTPGRQMTFWVMRGANPHGLPVEQWYAAQVRAMYPEAPPRTTRTSVGGRVAMRMNHEGTLGRDFLFYVALNRTDVFTITVSQPLSRVSLDDVYRRIVASIRFVESR